MIGNRCDWISDACKAEVDFSAEGDLKALASAYLAGCGLAKVPR